MKSSSSSWAWRIRIFVAVALMGWAASNPFVLQSALDKQSRLWTFDTDAPGTLPDDFVLGTLFDGRAAGNWKVVQKSDAPSPPNVFAQVIGKGAEHAYKLVLVEGSKSADLELEVSLLAVDGKADMGGGLVWRAADDRNYYLTRANPLEQNIRIYRVVKGVRQMIQNFDHIIDVRSWHKLRLVMKGCKVQVFFDQKQIFDLCDKTFAEGRVGLWTKSDAVTYFDDLKLERPQ